MTKDKLKIVAEPSGVLFPNVINPANPFRFGMKN